MLPGCEPWPDELVERYRRDGYWRGETLAGLIGAWSADHGERTALVAGSDVWSYRRLATRVNRQATGLRQLGIRAGDRVIVQLPNIPEFVSVSLALFQIGALPVFALPSHRRSEIGYLAQHAEAAAYVIPDTFQGFDYLALAREVRAVAPTLRHVIVAGEPEEFLALESVDGEPAALPPPDPRDVAFFLLSGGTTGLPKLIPRTHDDYAYQLRATAEALGVDERSVYLAALPAAHNAALGCPGVLGTLKAGGTVVLAPSASPDAAFPLIERHGVTFTTLMPPFVLLWLDLADVFGADLSSVLLQVGGAKFPAEVARLVRPVLGAPLTHWFGMAEGLLTYTRLDDPEDVVIHTSGRPLAPADEIRVVDEEGRDVAPGEVGELLTRGPYTLRGYYRAPEHNARAFTADGYFRSGDLVRLTPDGNMIVEGRIKDVVNRGGEKVSAEEIEDHLLAHPGIRNAAVVAMADAAMGEKTCAFIVPRAGPLERHTLNAFLRERGLADYKLIDRLDLVDALPSTAVGKVNKAELRRMTAGSPTS
ncbi:MAG TPA: AMP-binding protein [Actinomycetota bacterium]